MVTILFSPAGGIQSAIITAIESAKVSIEVAMYELTNDQISAALLTAKSKGVSIQLVLDKLNQRSIRQQAAHLFNAGINIRIWTGRGDMHAKYAVIDSLIAMYGSYNWSHDAEMINVEEFATTDDQVQVRTFQTNFATISAQSVPYKLP